MDPRVSSRPARRSVALAVGLLAAALEPGRCADCNGNGVGDGADIETGASGDCDRNGVPDECERGPLELTLGDRVFRFGGVPLGTVAADLDGDGVDDLAAITDASSVAVLRSRGDGTFETAVSYASEGRPRRLTWSDLEGDGDVDLVTANSSTLEVFENRGDGSFLRRPSVEVPSSTRFVEAADVFGDSRPDLVATNSSRDAVLVLEQSADGTFREPREFPAGDSPSAVAAADVDGDGALDLVVTNRGSEDVTILRNSDDPGFTLLERLEAPGGGPFPVLARDLSADGVPDVAVARANGVTVWLGEGGGVFAEGVLYPGNPESLAAADLDGDGDPDLAFGDSEVDEVRVLLNSGTGRFPASESLVVRLKRRLPSAGDFDGDGDTDLAATGLGFDGASILWNREPARAGLALRTTSMRVESRPHGIGVGDLDGDGLPEVISADGHFDSLTVFRNLGEGRFAGRDEHRLSGVGHFNDVEVIDVDGDGDGDLVAVDQDFSALRVLTNTGGGRLVATDRYASGSRPWRMTSADLDGDGDPDVAVAERGRGTVGLFFNDGGGGFAGGQNHRVGAAPLNVAAGDLDGDLDVDLAVAVQLSGTVSVLINEGGGSFADARGHPVPGTPGDITLGDYDRDGDLDIATPAGPFVVVLRNRGDASFGNPDVHDLSFAGDTITAADMDGDGVTDIIVASVVSNGVSVLLSDGRGGFRVLPRQAVGQQPLAVASVDLDLDGDVDVVTPNRGSLDVTALLNQSEPPVFEADFLEVICTGLDFFRLSVATRDDRTERVTKYIVPSADDPDLLPPVFQNSRRFPLHEKFLAAVFPDRFPGLTTEEYGRLVANRDTRSYFAGTVTRFRRTPGEGGAPGAEGVAWGFSVVGDEAPSLDEVRQAYRTLRGAFLLEPLGYLPDTTLAREAAREWRNPGFPLYLEGPPTGAGFRAYTPGVAYGRVRILDEEGFARANAEGLLSFQSLFVTGFAPTDIEGVVGATVTGAPQSELSHLAVRMARRGSPNAFLEDAAEVFAPWDGELVRLEVGGTGVDVSEATSDEAAGFWDRRRPALSGVPAADPGFRELSSLEEIATLDLSEPQEARFGGKATNLARLGRVLADGPYASLREEGFAVPVHYYYEFLRSNRMPSAFDPARSVTYEEHLRELAASELFTSDPAFRFRALEDFREHARENGEVPPGLVTRIAVRVARVFGGTRDEVRFRSSSNVEDLLELNGAGLYDSTGACAADDLDLDDAGPSACDRGRLDERGIARALRRVWMSLWNFRAYEEREFFGVPQDAAAMAVLVSRSFKRELANGVAFTGNVTNPLDRRYVVTVQTGEESVVSPDPGVLPEKDVLEVVDGAVARIIRPARGSSLVPEGTWVLSDAQLEELGTVMAWIDARFPVDLGDFPRDRVLLDMEFKVERGTESLAIKQIRPFLHTVPAPPSPEFELVIPAGTVACGVFSEAGSDRGPREELELKSTVRFRAGTFALPTRTEAFTRDIVTEVVFGRERRPARALSRGLFRVVRFPGAGGLTGYRVSYEQEFGLSDGRRLVLRLSPRAELRARGEEPLDDGRLLLDGDLLTTFAGEEVLLGWLDGEPLVHYGSCDHDAFPRFEVTAELDDGTTMFLEERFLAPSNVAKTGPASLAWARVDLGGESRVVSDYWRLVYSAFRHNTRVRYWVVLDEPATLPWIEAPVHALELAAPGDLDDTPATASYLGGGFEVLGRRRVAYRRAPFTRRPELAFVRGDSDASGGVNITDALVTLNWLFSGGQEPGCLRSADADDSGRVTIVDGIYLLNHLFLGGPDVPEPSRACGPDPTPDRVGCATYPPCA